MSNDANQEIIEKLHDEILNMSVAEFSEELEQLGYRFVMKDFVKKLIVKKFEELEEGGNDI
jgi:thermostable 8-oxoguanine DNA glycosylase|tara:strand:- start:77 stop:259 length:183 start_codon:yes stop_codon:yes gene_type:complete